MDLIRVNLPVCAHCPEREDPCAETCRCRANGSDVGANARAGTCPLGRFPDPSDPLARNRARPPMAIEDHDATPATAVSGGCGCSPPPTAS